ncbi:type IV secretion system protein VirB4, partial [Listeria monocytogenes]|nr:type IV secretion system protein VirB4 [Listeria monocytogenes]
FNLAPYKFVMNQDVESVEAISRAFRGQFSQAELERIPKLKTGHTILSISGYGNIHFKFDISQRERMISDGGA